MALSISALVPGPAAAPAQLAARAASAVSDARPGPRFV